MMGAVIAPFSSGGRCDRMEDEGEDGERRKEATDGRFVMRRVFALKGGSVVCDGDFGWWRGNWEE